MWRSSEDEDRAFSIKCRPSAPNPALFCRCLDQSTTQTLAARSQRSCLGKAKSRAPLLSPWAASGRAQNCRGAGKQTEDRVFVAAVTATETVTATEQNGATTSTVATTGISSILVQAKRRSGVSIDLGLEGEKMESRWSFPSFLHSRVGCWMVWSKRGKARLGSRLASLVAVGGRR